MVVLDPAAAIHRDEPGIDLGIRCLRQAKGSRQSGGAWGEQVILGRSTAAAEQVPARAMLAQDPRLRQDAADPTAGEQGDRHVACDVDCHRSEPTTSAQPRHPLQVPGPNQLDALSDRVVGHGHMLGGLGLKQRSIWSDVRLCRDPLVAMSGPTAAGSYPADVEADAPRLVERWPELASQVRSALIRDDETELATEIDALRVLTMCDCDEDFCQSFYTEPPPDGAYPLDRHRNWYRDNDEDDELGWEGFLILDVVDERIAFVEVLYRPPLD